MSSAAEDWPAVMEDMRKAHPEHGALLDKIQKLAADKLYHQLTEALIEFLSYPCFHYAKSTASSELFAIFEQFVRRFETRLDKVMWMRILQIVCKPQVATKALEMMEPFEQLVANNRDACMLWKILRAEKLTRAGKLDEAKDIAEAVGKEIAEICEADAMILSCYHLSNALLWKTLGRWQEYYRASTLYLAYTPLVNIAEDERAQLAFDVGVAALIAEEEFDFGDLLRQEILRSLEGSELAWIKDFLIAFGEGNFDYFDEAVSKHSSKLKTVPELVGKLDTTLRSKMCALALMELVFRKPKKQRTVSFEEVAQHCRVGMNLVEGLLMRAMCANLIRGQINEVSQTCSVTWVKPRILDIARVDMMREKIDAWSAQTELLLTTLEEMTPELLVS